MMTRATIVIGLMVVSSVLTEARLDGQSRPSDGEVTELLRCWWRTSVGAVAVGEPFEATITCAARDGNSVRVVPDESRLQPTAIQLAPFDVLDGSHPADLRTATHRFFQYRYTLRIIGADVIGRDAKFPDIQVHYRVHDRVAGDAVEGRDRVYLLPGQPVRVLSLVPLEAEDIRDSSNADFGTITGLRFRARALRLTSILLAALGLLVLTSALLRLVRRRAPAPERTESPVLPRAVLGQALVELTEVRRQSANGWTTDLVARAASAARIAAAIGLGRTMAHHKHVRGTLVPAGSLLCTRGWLRREDFVVSSSVTPGEVGQRTQQLPTRLAARRNALERLQRSLVTQTRALYAASSDLDGSALDDAVTEALAATQSLRRAHAWPSGWFGSRGLSRSAEAEA